MTLADYIEKLSSCDPVAVLVVLGMLVEITPIKINPISWALGWIGSKINKPLKTEIEQMKANSQKGLDEMSSNIEDLKTIASSTQLDLQNHVAESMRKDILDFQNRCLHKYKHTKEEWTYIHKLCDKYDRHIETNNLQNSEVEEAMHYIRKVYRKLLEDGDFVELLDQDNNN